MSNLITAVVQDKQVIHTAAGARLNLTFSTVDGHQVVIRAPIDNHYLMSLELLDRVSFRRDLRGCHHLQHQNRWLISLLKSIFGRKQLHSHKSLSKFI
jgi:hypothetical protein